MSVGLLVLIALLVVIALGIWPALWACAEALRRVAAAQEAQLRVYTSWCESQQSPFDESQAKLYYPEDHAA